MLEQEHALWARRNALHPHVRRGARRPYAAAMADTEWAGARALGAPLRASLLVRRGARWLYAAAVADTR